MPRLLPMSHINHRRPMFVVKDKETETKYRDRNVYISTRALRKAKTWQEIMLELRPSRGRAQELGPSEAARRDRRS